MRNWKIDETIAKLFRAALFLFILGINWWWDRNVLAILWQTGRDGSHFHLSDKVLIALVTTSVANFLALVLVIVKNLFPATPLGQAG